MLVSSGARLRKIDETQVSDVALSTVNQLKSLGVIVDSQWTFMAHVNAVAFWSF